MIRRGDAPVHVARYAALRGRWPAAARFKIVCLADPHVAPPWMDLERLERIVAQAQGLGGDLIALLGDYAGHLPFARRADAPGVAAVLAPLSAPLGVWAVMGNHDWVDDPPARQGHLPETFWHRAFREAGLEVLENRNVEITHGGFRFQLAGLGSQRAYSRRGGNDDLGQALADIPDGREIILLAHEPDVFMAVPERVALTLSGHTHGGQIRLGNWAPVVPSAYGQRFAWGHHRIGSKELVVSAGLGFSGVPIRIGAEPELLVVEVG